MFTLLCLALTAPLQHGGERALLIVDPGDPDALHIANHYAALRDLPAPNVLYMDPDAASYAALAGAQLRGFLGELQQRGIADSVDFAVLAPSSSFFVPASGLFADSCSPVSRFALPSAYGLHAYEALALGPGTPQVHLQNHYARGSWQAEGFRSELAWLNGLPSTSTSAVRYYIPASLGWLGTAGNSKAELLALIDRSVLADGTSPSGTAYYMQTTDPLRSGPRHSVYPTAVTQMLAAGGQAEHLQDVLPLGRHDVLGVMTGWATPDIDGGAFTLLPGAFCDHLTSFAATFDVASQTKMSRWLAKGASGTAGTVEEPCNYATKFPHPRLHVVYRRGLTLGEAWFRSMANVPFQPLFQGDPLTSPWQLAPTVAVTGLPTGPASGVLQLTVAAAPHPAGGTDLGELELFVDGVRRARSPLAGPGPFGLPLDTTALADGWHDVRVRVTDNTAARHHAVWRGALTVDNTGASVACAPNATTGDLGTRFELTLQAAGGTVDEVLVWQGSRIVAALAQGSGVAHVYGQNLGAGTVRLQAEARFDDGRRAWSSPVQLDVQDLVPPQGPLAAPVAYGYRRALAQGAPCVLDLPAAFDAPLPAADFAVTDAPLQATLLGGTGPARIFAPLPNASGVDLVRFAVTTPQGTSARAIVQLVYPAGAADARPVCTASANAFEPGARLGWRGSASVAADDLTLDVLGTPPSAFGLVFQGSGLARVPAGNGTLCVGAGFVRLGVVQADVDGRAQFDVDLGAPPSPAAAVQPGDTRLFQLWYRDVGGAAYNFSDALEVTFRP